MSFFDLGYKNNFNALEDYIFNYKKPITRVISAREYYSLTRDEYEKLIRRYAFPNARVYKKDDDVIIVYPPEYEIMTNPFTKPWPELGKHRCSDGTYQ